MDRVELAYWVGLFICSSWVIPSSMFILAGRVPYRFGLSQWVGLPHLFELAGMDDQVGRITLEGRDTLAGWAGLS